MDSNNNNTDNITGEDFAAELARMNAFFWPDGPPGANANSQPPPNRFRPPQWTIFTNRGVLPDRFRARFRRKLTDAFDALARLVTIYESNGQALLRPAENRKLDELLASFRSYLQWLEGDFELFLLTGVRPMSFYSGDIEPNRPQYFRLTRSVLRHLVTDHFISSGGGEYHQREHHHRIRRLKALLVELVRGLFEGLRGWAHQQVLREQAQEMAVVSSSGSGSEERGSGIGIYRQLPLTPRREGPSVETLTQRKEFALLAAGTEFLQAVQGLNSTAYYGMVALIEANHQPAWISGRGDYSYAGR